MGLTCYAGQITCPVSDEEDILHEPLLESEIIMNHASGDSLLVQATQIDMTTCRTAR